MSRRRTAPRKRPRPLLPQDEQDALEAQKLLEAQAVAQGFEFVGWRDVPQNKLILGELALEALPTLRAPHSTPSQAAVHGARNSP